MVQVHSIEQLKKYLITSQLVRLEQWRIVEDEVMQCADVAAALKVMERQQMLTHLQTQRIQKGNTDGLVLGRYKLLYRNASGSFARVYRGATLDDRQVVAIKLLRERWAADPEAVAGFHREARICQRFRHPNIVPILDVGSEGNFHFFTMEFIEGGNLRDFVRIRKTLSPGEASRCVYEICAGLEYALGMGVTHRDLKLTNVLMSSTGIARLVDFGLAGADSPSRVGTSDDVHRALEYASLERGTSAPPNDPRSDLFFAGSIMYELLSGESAWPRTRDREERKQLSRYTNTPPVASIRPNLPVCVTSIVDKMMKISPSDRYQSATEVMADLKAAMIELGEWTDNDEQQVSMDVGPPEPFRLLIVDSVKKRIRALQEYFERHEFKTSFVTNPMVAMERLKGDAPPDGILLLADNFTDDILTSFPQLQAYGRAKKVPCLGVFPREERERVESAIRSTRYGTAVFQPATLREIRQHFEEVGAITRMT
ncbi:MAG: serine/threonine-protein kinase [Fuerstiella sp.]